VDKEATAQMRRGTQEFALRVIRMYRALPRSSEAQVIGKQLLRSGTSVGANYRAACRARSTAEFVAKMGVVVEEADECVYWIELLERAEVVKRVRLQSIHAEADELLRIFSSSRATARAKLNKSTNQTANKS
jgi:four helix bundle protein